MDNTYFEIYVSPPRTGKLVKSFSEASDLAAATTAVQAACKELTDSPSRSEDVQAFVTRAFKDQGLLARIVHRFTLIGGGESSMDDLDAALARHAVREDLRLYVRNNLLGWASSEIQRQIELGRPAQLSFEEFRQELYAINKKLDNEHLLPCFATPPSPDLVSREIDFRTYIRQLKIIEIGDDELVTAANNFLKAASDRVVWASMGIVHETSFNEFADQLVDTWKNHRRRVEIAYKTATPVERGQLLLGECMAYQTRLQGRDLPHYFTPGCFHELADRPDDNPMAKPRVGWHPTYETNLGA